MYQRTYTTDWDFRNSDTKTYTHAYHPYPAMMIPQIARKLIEEYQPQNTNLIFDPYVGSGTTLVEAKLKGINSIGTDINPLARLIAKTKITNFEETEIRKANRFLMEKLMNYRPNSVLNYDHITNVDFWYSPKNLAELDFLSQLVKNVSPSVIDFYRVILAECIREVSYTRNGEFKRYRIAKDKIPFFKADTFKLFLNKIERNTQGLLEFNKDSNGAFSQVDSFNTVYEIPQEILAQKVDMVVTSPPYGDSRTTVAYGQFSRWANEWFRFENAKSLDKLLMGGSKTDLEIKTQVIENELENIKELDIKRHQEVLYFLHDYEKSIQNVAKTVRQNGMVCYVVGNRRVKGIQISLDYFTIETFEKEGFKHINTFVRNIPNKRMPSKTSPSNQKGKNVSTMLHEFIVILQKVK